MLVNTPSNVASSSAAVASVQKHRTCPLGFRAAASNCSPPRSTSTTCFLRTAVSRDGGSGGVAVAPKRCCGAAARGGRRRRRSRRTGSLRVDNSRWPAGGGQPRRPWSSPQGWSRRWRGRRRRPGRRCKRELVPRPRLRPKPCGRQQDAAPVSRMQCLYGRKPGAAEASWAAPGALRTFGVHTALPYGVRGTVLSYYSPPPR